MSRISEIKSKMSRPTRIVLQVVVAAFAMVGVLSLCGIPALWAALITFFAFDAAAVLWLGQSSSQPPRGRAIPRASITNSMLGGRPSYHRVHASRLNLN